MRLLRRTYRTLFDFLFGELGGAGRRDQEVYLHYEADALANSHKDGFHKDAWRDWH